MRFASPPHRSDYVARYVFIPRLSMPPLPVMRSGAHPSLMYPCPVSNISNYLTSRTNPPAPTAPTRPPQPHQPARPTRPAKRWPSRAQPGCGAAVAPASARGNTTSHTRTTRHAISDRSPVLVAITTKIGERSAIRITCRVLAKQPCTVARTRSITLTSSHPARHRRTRDHARSSRRRAARRCAFRLGLRHLRHQPRVPQPSCLVRFRLVWSSVRIPPDLRVDMIESVFDNQRGGERACGNQVDGDQAN